MLKGLILLRNINYCAILLILSLKKVKCSGYMLGVAQRVGGGIALLFHDRGTRRGWVVSSTPRPHFIPGKTWYPFYRRLGRPQGRSGQAENLVASGIRSRTVQPVVSRYTDWATRPTLTFPVSLHKYNECEIFSPNKFGIILGNWF